MGKVIDNKNKGTKENSGEKFNKLMYIMRYFKWFIFLVVFCLYLQNLAFAQEKIGSKMVREIPTEVQLFSDDILKNIPGIRDKIVYFTWPSDKKIASLLRLSDEKMSDAEKKRPYPNWVSTEKQTVTEAKRMATKWIRTVLKNEWIPDDIDVRLIALDSYINSYDAICVRYEYNGYYIQIVQTNPEIVIIIKSIFTKGKEQNDIKVNLKEKQIEFVYKKTGLFFNESEKIKKISTTKIKTFSKGLIGKPEQRNVVGALNQWWGNIYWWTDGETIAFSILKYYGGAGIPFGLPKDWF